MVTQCALTQVRPGPDMAEVAIIDVSRWDNVAVARRGGVTELRLHTRGEPLVWSVGAERDLTEAFTWLQTDDATKVVLLRGSGGAWCRDIDLEGFADLSWEEVWLRGRRLLSSLDDVPVPVVAAVNGPVTVHPEVPVMADIVLAAEHAEFADHVHFVRGVVPGDGVNLVWKDLLGTTRANYFLLTGEVLAAREAQRLGVVNEVMPAEKLTERAHDLAARMAINSRRVLLYTKAALSIGSRRDVRTGVSHGLAVQGAAHGPRATSSQTATHAGANGPSSLGDDGHFRLPDKPPIAGTIEESDVWE
jgi:enoyl-CoA hydratase/carnithine racemase